MGRYLLQIPLLAMICLIMEFTVNAAETYTYDTVGRLTSVTYDDGTKITYGYDNNGNQLSRTIFVPNVAPVAADDNATLQTDTSLAISVLGNDSDSDGSLDATSVAIVADANNGTTEIDPVTGVITYTSTGGYVGADTVTYTVNDDEGATSNVGTVNITVTVAPVNQPPVATNDSATTAQDTNAVIDILANDSDSDGTIDATTVAIVTDVTNGATSIDPATGIVTYTPTAGYNGADSFTYTVKDDGGETSNVATVSITIQAPPPNEAPVATNDSATTNYETVVTINVVANDSDSDGSIDNSSVVIVTDAQNGVTAVAASGNVAYTPANDFSGNDSFTYTVNDDDGATSNVATVTITVRAKPSSGSGGGGGTQESVVLVLLLTGLIRRFSRK